MYNILVLRKLFSTLTVAVLQYNSNGSNLSELIFKYSQLVRTKGKQIKAEFIFSLYIFHTFVSTQLNWVLIFYWLFLKIEVHLFLEQNRTKEKSPWKKRKECDELWQKNMAACPLTAKTFSLLLRNGCILTTIFFTGNWFPTAATLLRN